MQSVECNEQLPPYGVGPKYTDSYTYTLPLACHSVTVGYLALYYDYDYGYFRRRKAGNTRRYSMASMSQVKATKSPEIRLCGVSFSIGFPVSGFIWRGARGFILGDLAI